MQKGQTTHPEASFSQKYSQGGSLATPNCMGAERPHNLSMKAKPELKEQSLAATSGSAQFPALSILRVEITDSSQPSFISGTDDNSKSV